jgi:hypothetical protein
LLAPYITVEAIRDLATGHQAGESILGITVTAGSLIVMPILGVAKRRLGNRLDSGATKGEGLQNLICAAQAGPSWPDWPPPPRSDGVGSIRSSDCCWPAGRPAKGLRPGRARTAASVCDSLGSAGMTD